MLSKAQLIGAHDNRIFFIAAERMDDEGLGVDALTEDRTAYEVVLGGVLEAPNAAAVLETEAAGVL